MRSMLALVIFITLLPMSRARHEEQEVAQGDMLQARLNGPVDYLPSSDSVLQQLIDTSRHYKIPMGLEWADESGIEGVPKPQRTTTVLQLIEQIVSTDGGYEVSIGDNVVHIAKPAIALDKRNILALHIDNFEVYDGNLWDARALLLLKIKMRLYPSMFAGGGYGGGHGSGGTFGKSKITIVGENLTVREILDRIVLASGDALWKVDLNPDLMMEEAPFFAQGYSEDFARIGYFICQFIPFDKN